ncbi:endo-1,4-beta-xylanase [Flavobacterium magnesitis]|uniref:endo-1,4-beta-xylanase n=1 Tax=Flavobacterium magnesitis TaxID=3138077 RepID=UPI00358F439D
MKNIFKFLPISALLFSLASCTESHLLPFEVEKPSNIADQEVIDAYADLKSYVDRTANPNFKLGLGVSLNEYTSKSLMYRLANRNFDEITLGYEMKHGAIVQADGTLKLDKVQELLETAAAANVSVFGHTLCWHANQNATYLNKLIAPVKIPGGTEPIESGYALKFSNSSIVNPWVVQTIYDITPTELNVEYILKFAAKGSKAGTISSDLQATSNYSGNNFGNIVLTTSYKEYELRLTTTAARNRFIFNHGQFDGTVFIDNITLRKAGSNVDIISGGDFETALAGWGGWGPTSTRVRSAVDEGFGGFGGATIEKTPEQKKVIIGEALDNWITGMVTNCAPYVKAWDVVNEPMSDWPNQFELKTGVGKTNMAADEFYWQDYLGKDYAVEAFRLARLHGNPNDILFINDYGLEGGGDKCDGLIQYVNYIESKGQTVDGIGTQMHVTFGETTIERIRTMLTKLAATGKLVKISELDMGIKVGGVMVKTENVTPAQLQQMSDFYKEIVEAYFDIVPAAQRYGITQWAATDSPANSSWRGGEPIGLWNLNYTRKPAYTGFAEGLKSSK